MVLFNLWCSAFVGLAVSSLAAAASSGQLLTAENEAVYPSVSPPHFSRTQQNDSLCDAGSAQWTGSIRVGKDRNLFYCKYSGLISVTA